MSKCPECSAELATFEEHRYGMCLGCLKQQIRQARIQGVPRLLAEYQIPVKYRRLDWTLGETLGPYVASPRGLCLTGPVGVGKTTALCLLARDWLLRWTQEAEVTEEEMQRYRGPEGVSETSWRFISFPAFVMEIQDAWRREETEETALTLLKRVARVPRLIIDDLGAERLTDYVRQATYYLINEREQWERTTYIASNYPLRELDRQLDSRISSRIAGTCDIKALKGEDLRIRRLREDP